MKITSATATDHSLPRNYASELMVLAHGSGSFLFDTAGNRYLDFGSGIAVNALGYGRADLAAIAAEQMAKLIHVSNLYATEPGLAFADMVVRSSPVAADQPWRADRHPHYFAAVHFGNSGTEANEAAIKYARLYAQRTKGPGHHRILALHNGFHGRTIGALSVTANPAYREPFAPLIPDVEFVPFNATAELVARLDTTFAAVIVEVVQGEGGLTVMEPQFAAALQAACAEHNVLIIADEVQTGLGRTGTLFACEAVGLRPDIISLSKPLAGGLPLSATLIPSRLNTLLQVGDHGSTFGGGPVTTAVAAHVWRTVADPEFLSGVQNKGAYLRDRLAAVAARFGGVVAGICGRGLLQGIALKNADHLAPVLAEAKNRGVLVLRSGKNVVRIAPPLVVDTREIDTGVDALEQAIAQLS